MHRPYIESKMHRPYIESKMHRPYIFKVLCIVRILKVLRFRINFKKGFIPKKLHAEIADEWQF